MKQAITINENQLKEMIRNSIKNILRESSNDFEAAKYNGKWSVFDKTSRTYSNIGVGKKKAEEKAKELNQPIRESNVTSVQIQNFLNSGWDMSDPKNFEMTMDAIGRLKGYIPQNTYNYISNILMELPKEPENKMRCQHIANTIRDEVKQYL